jgi:hypothetical protein
MTTIRKPGVVNIGGAAASGIGAENTFANSNALNGGNSMYVPAGGNTSNMTNKN